MSLLRIAAWMLRICLLIWISRVAVEGYAMQFPICIGTGSAQAGEI